MGTRPNTDTHTNVFMAILRSAAGNAIVGRHRWAMEMPQRERLSYPVGDRQRNTRRGCRASFGRLDLEAIAVELFSAHAPGIPSRGGLGGR
jgi:hypothetical protein